MLSRTEVPQKPPPWRLRQEGAAVLELVLAHAIHALVLGVLTVTGYTGRAKS